MEKMTKIAKMLDGILKFVQVCVTGVLILMLAGSVIVLIAPQISVAEFMSYSVEMGPATFELAHDVFGDALMSKGQLFFTIFTIALMFGVTVYEIKIQRKIIAPMKDGLPFAEDVYKNMIRLSAVILVCGLIGSVWEMISEMMVINVFGIPDLLMSIFEEGKVLGYTVQYSFDMGFIINAAGCFMFACIFKYGSLLQTQADETL